MANCEVCGGRIPLIGRYFFCSDLYGRQHKICASCNDKAVREKKGFWYDEKKARVLIVESEEIEIHRLCDACGNIFIFNCMDVYNNVALAKSAKSDATISLLDTFAGNTTSGAVYIQSSEQKKSRIRDFNTCPKCGSRMLRDISLSEYREIKEKETANNVQKTSEPSSADEILKFKSLLDGGIITQEEFEAKKKQLLGL